MPQFETFTKRMIPLSKQPFVTIQKRGIMSFNAAAYAALGSPDAVELLYDPDAKIIGVRGVSPEVEHAYPIRSQQRRRESTYMVSGTAFTKYYGIPTEVATRRQVTMDGNILCVDLNDPGTTVTGNRTKADDTPADEALLPGWGTKD